MAQDRKLETVSGRVTSELVQQGTGSEHEAVVLRTAAGERVILQRLGGNPFDDAETRGLLGRDVELDGYRLGVVFRFRGPARELDR